MLREIIEGKTIKSKVFKYNNEEWQVSYNNESLDVNVDANGIWTNVHNEDTKVKNEKDAIKQAKKVIDSFHQYK